MGGVGCVGSEVIAVPPPLRDDNRVCLFSLPSDVCLSYSQIEMWGCFQAESERGGGPDGGAGVGGCSASTLSLSLIEAQH